MRAQPPPPIPLPQEGHRLAPNDMPRPNTASRPSTAASDSSSPPQTPQRATTFSLQQDQPVNPFSPPASIRSFGTDSAMASPTQETYPFPQQTGGNSGSTSVAASQVDLPRVSSYSSVAEHLPRVSSYYGYTPRTSTSDRYSIQSSTLPSSLSASRLRETFSSPPSRPVTLYSAPSSAKLIRERPKSTMISDELQKPWLSSHDPYERVAYFLTYGVMLLGVVAGAIKCYFDWNSVPMIKGNLCLVLDEGFDNPDTIFGDNGVFFREVDMSGFGNGEFEMTTSSPNNSFVLDGHLYIVPTLTTDSIPEDAMLDGHVYNITDCTFNITRGLSYTGSTKPGTTAPLTYNTSAISADTFDADGYYRACSAVSNSTSGKIINPIQSARLSTRKTASIRYGKVEVRAKIPTGDWLWPAIWMMPVDNTYGQWPLSGEIDIMEARGNDLEYSKQGTNYVRGSLNWGPTQDLNRGAQTTGWWKLRRGGYNEEFHTYTLEWTEDFIRISVDTRLHHLLDLSVKDSFWNRGEFPNVVHNGSDIIALTNPWSNGTKVAPFDQRFYLILDVGVGGTNGWFPDGKEKPWLDGSPSAMRDFWQARDQWLPTWPQDVRERGMVIDSVKMWQQC